MYSDLEKSVKEILDLSELVVNKLKEKKLKIVTVESCTGGGLAFFLTNIVGASDILMDSFVTYSNEAKINLGVPAEIIKEYTVYSEETAKAMAEAGLNRSVGASLGVGITGSISRVDPNNPNSNLGKVYFSIKSKEKSFAKTIYVESDLRFFAKQSILKEVLVSILAFLK